MIKKFRRTLATVVLLTCFRGLHAQPSAPVVLARDGKALHDVNTLPGAGERTVKAAAELAQYLDRISGADFKLVQGDGTHGIVVGTAADLPGKSKGLFEPQKLMRREEYRIQSHANGLLLVGATELAVEHAVWDLLDRLGYRHFFPGELWEVVPTSETLQVNLDVFAKPSFLDRAIGKDGSWLRWQRDDWERWQRHNRVTSGLTMRTSHQYQAILAARRPEFERHPEYLGLVNGERRSSKFCISNPGLRALVIDYALKYFAKNPGVDSISMEPSDGGGWCECEACAAMGSISDRAATLASVVAAAVTEKFDARIVGMGAYNEHAPVPTVRLHSNVWVSVATHQRKGSESFEELMEGWRRQGAGAMGVGEAYCTRVWDHYLPGRPRGAGIGYIRRTIPHYHALGARRVGGWTSDAWGPVGLGNYLAARLLWDVGAADRTDELFEDFVVKAFGAAREPMERFYRLIYRFEESDPIPLMSEDLLGRMYRLLEEARGAARTPEERARIGALVLYTRYVELFQAYERAETDRTGDGLSPAQKVFSDLIQHAYRTHRTTHMIDSNFLFWRAREVFPDGDLPEGVAPFSPENQDPWKDGSPFKDEEITRITAAGIADNRLLDFKPVSFSGDLVPALGLGLDDTPLRTRRDYPGRYDGHARAVHVIYTWVDRAPRDISLLVKGGLARRNQGNVDVRLIALAAIDEGGEPRPVAIDHSVPPDGQERLIALRTPHQGLHRVEVRSGGDRSVVRFADETMPHTLESGIERPYFDVIQRWNLYFYVPRGTRQVGGYAAAVNGSMLDGAGQEIFKFSELGHPGYFCVRVPEGQDGRLWKMHQCTGRRILMTVPPYLAASLEELLLPSEVVIRDRQQLPD